MQEQIINEYYCEAQINLVKILFIFDVLNKYTISFVKSCISAQFSTV